MCTRTKTFTFDADGIITAVHLLVTRFIVLSTIFLNVLLTTFLCLIKGRGTYSLTSASSGPGFLRPQFPTRPLSVALLRDVSPGSGGGGRLLQIE
jgi:hypothetical protein